MKRLVLIIAITITSGLCSFEPPVRVQKENSKEKGRTRERDSSGSNSSSGGEASSSQTSFAEVDLSRLDTDRMVQQGKIVIGNIAELENALRERGIDPAANDQNKRLSIVYLPHPREILPVLNLEAITRDVSNQNANRRTPDLERGPDIRPPYDQKNEKENFDKEFSFLLQILREKTKNPDLNLKSIEAKLKKEFEEAHNTPPSTPTDRQLHRKKKTVDALRKASIYQETARESRQQEIEALNRRHRTTAHAVPPNITPQSPAVQKLRDPHALEIFEAIISDKDVHETLEELKDQIIGLLDAKNGKTQSTLSNTRWGALAGVVISGGFSALIAYLGTKKSC